MSRDHFKKAFESPYFQSEAYKETTAGKFEKKLEKIAFRFFGRLKFWKH